MHAVSCFISGCSPSVKISNSSDCMQPQPITTTVCYRSNISCLNRPIRSLQATAHRQPIRNEFSFCLQELMAGLRYGISVHCCVSYTMLRVSLNPGRKIFLESATLYIVRLQDPLDHRHLLQMFRI